MAETVTTNTPTTHDLTINYSGPDVQDRSLVDCKCLRTWALVIEDCIQ